MHCCCNCRQITGQTLSGLLLSCSAVWFNKLFLRQFQGFFVSSAFPRPASQVWVCTGYVFMTTQATSNVKGVSRFQATIESQGPVTCSQATFVAMEVDRFQATIERQGCVRCSQEMATLDAWHVLFDPSPLWHPELCSDPAYGMGCLVCC